MKAKKKKRAREHGTDALIADLAKRGELNPRHRHDFNNLLDDVAPPITPKKK